GIAVLHRAYRTKCLLQPCAAALSVQPNRIDLSTRLNGRLDFGFADVGADWTCLNAMAKVDPSGEQEPGCETRQSQLPRMGEQFHGGVSLHGRCDHSAGERRARIRN